MQQNDTLQSIIGMICQLRFGKAAAELENYLLTHPQQGDMDRLQSIKADFALMAQYWQEGYDDPQREALYLNLLRRLYVLTCNMMLNNRLRGSSFMMSLYQKPRHAGKVWSVDVIRRELEDFVSEQALLELEPEHVRKEKTLTLYQKHVQLMSDIFDFIVTSRLWPDGLSQSFEEMLLAPTIDAVDQQLIVSAITLSVLQAFGHTKFNVLVDVFQKTDNEQLRQRCLVGWVLALDERTLALFPDVGTTVRQLCEDSRTLAELTELQMQLIYCSEADDDGRKIRNEIMPDLMSGSGMKLTRQGFEEVDEESLEEILHPEAAEQNMSRMEESMHKMVDMQKQGADIYFGGFSQMKRFPFFSQLSSWFTPFYAQHPAIMQIWEKTKGKRFLKIITEIGAFCDSDKYSFVLAFEQVVSRLPQSMLTLIEQGEASPVPLGGEIPLDEQRQPAFMRRMYLQNLYRFYRLFHARNEFLNPFADAGKYLFFANGLFRGTRLEERFMEVAAFLLKHGRKDEAQSVLKGCGEKCHDFHYYMMMGSLVPSGRSAFYKEALRLSPDSEHAKACYARACYHEQRYDEAIVAYQSLAESHPEHRSYLLNLAASMANVERYADAEQILFKLQYLYPDDMGVVRILAWTLMCEDKLEQAAKYYHTLMEQAEPQSEDYFNYGLCLWFMHRIADAIGAFRHCGESLERLFGEEPTLLRRHGIGTADLQLMLSCVS